MISEGEIDELSSRSSRYPQDLLRGLAGGDCTPTVAGGGDAGEVELSLGLSLGGCFGVEPREKTRLVRFSSTSTLSMFPIERERVPIERTRSVPVETEAEMRRKEMQSLKRLKAKRKRSEKKAAMIAMAKDRKENLEEDEKLVNGTVIPAELTRWGGGGRRPALQGSIGSQESSSSGLSDFESRAMPQGINGTEVRSVTTIPPHNHTKPTNISREIDKPSRKGGCTVTVTGRKNINGVKEMERNMVEEMPCVSTKGDGPNGRKIEGFLYQYRKGEDVRIVCVCHGIVLTPAEFVKHAGGGNVAHPLRHIIVGSSPAGPL